MEKGVLVPRKLLVYLTGDTKVVFNDDDSIGPIDPPPPTPPEVEEILEILREDQELPDFPASP